MRIAKFCFAVLLAFASASLLPGQTLGEITGEVHDPSGSVVVGAEVTSTNDATGAVRSVLSNNAGLYSFPSLQPGVYTLKVTMPGFQAVTGPISNCRCSRPLASISRSDWAWSPKL
jgi:hypothetical protein